MIRWAIRLIFPLLAVLAGVQMFVLKYQVIEKEDELKKIHKQITDDMREIHLLEADWASANDPNLIRAFVQEQTTFQPIRAKQFITVDSLPVKAVPVPTQKPEFADQEGETP